MAERLISLAQAFDLGATELIAFTGGGGKTSLMIALSQELSGGVIVTTTTRLGLSQLQLVPEVIMFFADEPRRSTEGQTRSAGITGRLELNRKISESLEHGGRCLVVGEQMGEKVRGIPVDLPGQLLILEKVDFVLVEADGSRGLPCKAPGPHEPVIPPEATIVVPTIGIDAVGKPLSKIAHRPELVSSIIELDLDHPMTERGLARLVAHPKGGLKGIPQHARIVPFVNKVDSDQLLDKARNVARLLLKDDRIDRVIVGSARSDRPVREIHRRITAVVLAAGQSSRMGRPKQLLPWAETTVLGQTISNLQRSLVDEIVVISGFQAQEISQVSAQFGVSTFVNEDFEIGGMISSVQTALNNIPANREAILIMLADQPMVDTGTLDTLVEAWLRNQGELIAPVYGNRRGNPVIVGRRYFDELLSLPRGSAPRELLRKREEDLALIEVETNAILQDLDRIEDYERWRPKSDQD